MQPSTLHTRAFPAHALPLMVNLSQQSMSQTCSPTDWSGEIFSVIDFPAPVERAINGNDELGKEPVAVVSDDTEGSTPVHVATLEVVHLAGVHAMTYVHGELGGNITIIATTVRH